MFKDLTKDQSEICKLFDFSKYLNKKEKINKKIYDILRIEQALYKNYVFELKKIKIIKSTDLEIQKQRQAEIKFVQSYNNDV